jgi:hypothetical protein
MNQIAQFWDTGQFFTYDTNKVGVDFDQAR